MKQVGSLVLLYQCLFLFRLWYWTSLFGTNWHRSYSGNWSSSLGLAVQGPLQRILPDPRDLQTRTKHFKTIHWPGIPTSPFVVSSKFELRSNTIWWTIMKYNTQWERAPTSIGRLADWQGKFKRWIGVLGLWWTLPDTYPFLQCFCLQL